MKLRLSSEMYISLQIPHDLSFYFTNVAHPLSILFSSIQGLCLGNVPCLHKVRIQGICLCVSCIRICTYTMYMFFIYKGPLRSSSLICCLVNEDSEAQKEMLF